MPGRALGVARTVSGGDSPVVRGASDPADEGKARQDTGRGLGLNAFCMCHG
jgi:hypothetical protein